MVLVVKEGKNPDETRYQHICKNCNSILSYTNPDLRRCYDEKGREARAFICPICGRAIVIDYKTEVFDDNMETNKCKCEGCPVSKYCGTMVSSIRLCKSIHKDKSMK